MQPIDFTNLFGLGREDFDLACAGLFSPYRQSKKSIDRAGVKRHHSHRTSLSPAAPISLNPKLPEILAMRRHASSDAAAV
jgi:hypothetical protein